jgi:capsid protein
LPSFNQIDHRWHWPPLPELDPVDSANAAKIRLASGLSTPTEELARRGKDWETEAARAAIDFGVTAEEYKQAVFAATFTVPGAGVAPAAPAPAEGLL